jgi:hypothetical protein
MLIGREASLSAPTSSSLSSTLVPNFRLYCGKESGFLATETCSLSTDVVASLLHFDYTQEDDYQVNKGIEIKIKITHTLHITFQIQILNLK